MLVTISWTKEAIWRCHVMLWENWYEHLNQCENVHFHSFTMKIIISCRHEIKCMKHLVTWKLIILHYEWIIDYCLCCILALEWHDNQRGSFSSGMKAPLFHPRSQCTNNTLLLHRSFTSLVWLFCDLHRHSSSSPLFSVVAQHNFTPL